MIDLPGGKSPSAPTIRMAPAIFISTLLTLSGGLAAEPEEKPMPPELTMQEVVPTEFDTFWIAFLYRADEPPLLSDEQRERNQIDHLAYLRNLTRSREIITPGPFEVAPDAQLRGMTLLPGSLSRERVEEIVANDPHVNSGAIRIEILKWHTAKGALTWPEESVW